MVEAQLGLLPRSLRPCHPLDRPASGLVLCCTSPDVARVIQGRMTEGHRGGAGADAAVSKLYVARDRGRFPRSPPSSPPDKGPNPASASAFRKVGGAISERDAAAAVEACRICSDLEAGGGAGDGHANRCRFAGIEASFSPAQLLEAGHAIDPHALGYRVRFEKRRNRKKKKSKKQKRVSGDSAVDAGDGERDGNGVCNGNEGMQGEGGGAQPEEEEKDHKEEEEELASVEFSADLPAWAKAFGEQVTAEIGWLE